MRATGTSTFSLLCDDHFFFFNDTATTEIYTLSLHDALPISLGAAGVAARIFDAVIEDPTTREVAAGRDAAASWGADLIDRKSTRLNSSHANISYAVFCLKKKKRELGNASTRTVNALRVSPVV